MAVDDVGPEQQALGRAVVLLVAAVRAARDDQRGRAPGGGEVKGGLPPRQGLSKGRALREETGREFRAPMFHGRKRRPAPVGRVVRVDRESGGRVRRVDREVLDECAVPFLLFLLLLLRVRLGLRRRLVVPAEQEQAPPALGLLGTRLPPCGHPAAQELCAVGAAAAACVLERRADALSGGRSRCEAEAVIRSPVAGVRQHQALAARRPGLERRHRAQHAARLRVMLHRRRRAAAVHRGRGSPAACRPAHHEPAEAERGLPIAAIRRALAALLL
eukprot:COSAG04_NODE_324_length_16823_cov_176.872937_6_plen_274_part_00